MEMPVIVGVVLAIIFLIVFSEWFYHTFVGWREVVIDDRLYKLRIFGASLFSMFVIFASFMGMAYVTKCPNETREGAFERLNCDEYKKIKTQFGFLPKTEENNK